MRITFRTPTRVCCVLSALRLRSRLANRWTSQETECHNMHLIAGSWRTDRMCALVRQSFTFAFTLLLFVVVPDEAREFVSVGLSWSLLLRKTSALVSFESYFARNKQIDNAAQ